MVVSQGNVVRKVTSSILSVDIMYTSSKWLASLCGVLNEPEVFESIVTLY